MDLLDKADDYMDAVEALHAIGNAVEALGHAARRLVVRHNGFVGP